MLGCPRLKIGPCSSQTALSPPLHQTCCEQAGWEEIGKDSVSSPGGPRAKLWLAEFFRGGVGETSHRLRPLSRKSTLLSTEEKFHQMKT